MPVGPFLEDLVRVFANLQVLSLAARSPAAQGSIDAVLVHPLEACTGLTDIYVRMHVRFSTKYLSQLCQRMPALERVHYLECEGVDHVVLEGALPLVDVHIDLSMYNLEYFSMGVETGSDEEPAI